LYQLVITIFLHEYFSIIKVIILLVEKKTGGFFLIFSRFTRYMPIEVLKVTNSFAS